MNLNKIARALADRAKLFDGAVAKVGIPAGKTYPDGTSIGYIAAVQEYGADVPAHQVVVRNAKALAIPTKDGGTRFAKRANLPAISIPSRPFMRLTRAAKATEWAKRMADGAEAVVQRRIGLDDMLEVVGAAAAADVVQTLADRVSPPLKPSTVENRVRRAQRANKRFGAKSLPVTISQPLNDTGALIAHVSHGVGAAGEEFENGTAVKGGA